MNLQASALDPNNIIGEGLALHTDLDNIWGNGRFGLLLCQAYFSSEPKTSQEMATTLGVSDETIRRWLKPLINIDRVRVIKNGRSVTYKAREDWAIKTRKRMMTSLDTLNDAEPNVVPDRLFVVPASDIDGLKVAAAIAAFSVAGLAHYMAPLGIG